jgi:lysophospholipase L1-like esterase
MKSIYYKYILLGTFLASGIFYYLFKNRIIYYSHRYSRSLYFKSYVNCESGAIFIGDSQIELYKWEDDFKNEFSCVYNYGISGETSGHLLRRISKMEHLGSYSIFINIGINDLFANKSEDLVKNYKKILDILKNEHKANNVYIISLIPVSSHRKLDNSFIKLVNNRIMLVANEYIYTYIDVFDSFLDCSGFLSSNLSDDGLHFNQKGYSFLVKRLKSCIRE